MKNSFVDVNRLNITRNLFNFMNKKIQVWVYVRWQREKNRPKVNGKTGSKQAVLEAGQSAQRLYTTWAGSATQSVFLSETPINSAHRQ